MEKLTIKAYAAKHKLSIFDVVKMTKSGELQTQSAVENGKETLYILIDDDVGNKVNESIVQESKKESYSLRKEMERLKQEVKELKKEIALLKKRV